MLPHLADDGGEYLAKISEDGEGEGNTDDGKEDAEQAARKGDWGNVTIANGGEDGGGEED